MGQAEKNVSCGIRGRGQGEPTNLSQKVETRSLTTFINHFSLLNIPPINWITRSLSRNFTATYQKRTEKPEIERSSFFKQILCRHPFWQTTQLGSQKIKQVCIACGKVRFVSYD